MKTRIQKWGNSLAVRIPRPFAEESNLREDSTVDVSLRNGKLVVVPLVESTPSLEELARISHKVRCCEGKSPAVCFVAAHFRSST